MCYGSKLVNMRNGTMGDFLLFHAQSTSHPEPELSPLSRPLLFCSSLSRNSDSFTPSPAHRSLDILAPIPLCLVLMKMLSGVSPSTVLHDKHFQWWNKPRDLKEGEAGSKECGNLQHSEWESQYGDIFCHVHAEVYSEIH